MGSKGFIGTTSFFGAKNTFSRTTHGFIKNHLRRGEWAEARFMIRRRRARAHPLGGEVCAAAVSLTNYGRRGSASEILPQR